jgi:hypothetical protein
VNEIRCVERVKLTEMQAAVALTERCFTESKVTADGLLSLGQFLTFFEENPSTIRWYDANCWLRRLSLLTLILSSLVSLFAGSICWSGSKPNNALASSPPTFGAAEL